MGKRRSAGRSGGNWRKLRANLKAQRLPCHLCGQKIAYDAPMGDPEAFEVDHFYPVSTHPHLANDPANARACHARCNRKRGTKPVELGAWVTAEEW